MTDDTRVAVLVHGYPANPVYRDNLVFFLAAACRPELEIICLIAGESDLALPELPNLRCIPTPNLGHDIGSLAFALKQGLDLSGFAQIIAVNGSARGPFLPTYHHGSWTRAFTDQLRGTTHLCGATINGLPASSPFFARYQNAYSHAPPYSHVQTYAYAMTQECFQHLSAIGLWKDADAMGKEEAVIHCEIRMSQEVKRRGWRISCLLPTYNWLEEQADREQQARWTIPGHPASAGSYHGTTLHPYDTIFIKTGWGIIHDDALDLYSLIALKTRPFSLCRRWPEAADLLQRLESRHASRLLCCAGPDTVADAAPATASTAALPAATLSAAGRKALRRCLLVLGMHRSGTSALAGTLSLLGAQMPMQLMKADQHNPLGFFESQSIMELNQDILAAMGCDWFDHQPYAWAKLSSLQAGFAQQAHDLLRQNYGEADLIVLKDPRIDRLLPFWIPVLQSAHYQITPLLIVRHPEEVAASLADRNGIAPAYGRLLWLRHVLEAERGSRGLARTVLGFDQFLSHPRRCLDRIASEHGLHWHDAEHGRSGSAPASLAALLNPGLRHHEHGVGAEPAGAAVSDPLTNWIEEAHRTLLLLAENQAQTSHLRRLECIQQMLNEASAVLGALVKHVPKPPPT